MSQFKPRRPKDLPRPRRPNGPPASTRSIRLTPLRDDRGNLLGYVDPAFGRLYKPNMRPSAPTVGLRVSRAHRARRDAADRLGIRANATVAQAEADELAEAEAVTEAAKG